MDSIWVPAAEPGDFGDQARHIWVPKVGGVRDEIQSTGGPAMQADSTQLPALCLCIFASQAGGRYVPCL